ncbi:MAG: hypothetical protein LW599_06210, partial [Rickettsiaceae bacterium]|nr:hypothetical protein [Rickettsiaceae bacterium]
GRPYFNYCQPINTPVQKCLNNTILPSSFKDFRKNLRFTLRPPIRNALNAGITNIDIGVGQINYRWHGDNFKGIEEMLNPVINIEYAGKLLSSLFKEHGDWFKALKYYHSAKAQYHVPYSRKIFVAWLGDSQLFK